MLVEDVKRSGMGYGIFERMEEAWAWWKEWVPSPAHVRVVGDDDSDGLTSAWIVSTALRRAGYHVETKMMAVHSPDDVDAAMKEPRDAYVILDAGSSVIEKIDSFGTPTLVLDHHRVHDIDPKNTFEVNPRRIGGDKAAHVSTSVLAGLFAVTVDDHWDLSFAGVAGGISDRQHLGGFQGLLGYLANGAVRRGIMAPSTGLTLVGENVLEAITESLDPYFEAYAGKPDEAKALLARHRVEPRTSPVALTGDPAFKLAKELTESLQRKGVVTDRMYPLYGERYMIQQVPEVQTVFTLASLMEAATAEKAFDIALGVLGGDQAAVRHAKALHKKRQTYALVETARLRTKTQELRNLRWAETIDEGNTGVYAHALLTFIHGDDKPFVVAAKRGEDAKFSARGSSRLFQNGVDLSIGMSKAAEAFGGHGGGHPGASGATVPYKDRDAFLARLDEVLGQLRRGPT